MRIFRSSGFLVCLSAFLFVLGAYLAIVEVPVQITYDTTAAEQYDLMRAYLPFGFALWILALISLTYGIVLGARKPLAVARLKDRFLTISIVVGMVLGFLTLSSAFLPWVITERTEPFIETRGGTFNVGQHHALTGIGLMIGVNSMVGDIILLVFVGALIGVLHIPLIILLEGEKVNVIRALLFLLSGICIIYPAISIYAHKTWWISMPIDGALGFTATFKSPGIGFLIATICAISLIAYGIITILIARPTDSR